MFSRCSIYDFYRYYCFIDRVDLNLVGTNGAGLLAILWVCGECVCVCGW